MWGAVPKVLNRGCEVTLLVAFPIPIPHVTARMLLSGTIPVTPAVLWEQAMVQSTSTSPWLYSNVEHA